MAEKMWTRRGVRRLVIQRSNKMLNAELEISRITSFAELKLDCGMRREGIMKLRNEILAALRKEAK